MRSRHVLVATLVLVACSGGDDAGISPSPADTGASAPTVTVTDPPIPSPTTSPPATTSSTGGIVPTSAPPPVEPAGVGLLVPSPEGLALWQDGEVDWLVTDRAVAAAVPDLTGGVLFQYADPAVNEWVWDGALPRWTASWARGGPEPILRQRNPGGPVEVAVEPAGTRLWLLDVGTADGEPALAFGRLVGGADPIAVGFDYCAEAGLCGEFSWRVEFVVRPVEGGPERVVHRALWQPGITESTAYTARWGGDLAALSVHPYGGDPESWAAVDLFDLDGAPVDAGYRASPWCTGCDIVADLAPEADVLAYVERYQDPEDANLTAHADAVLVDTDDWVERWRVEVDGGVTIDTDGTRAVIQLGGTCAFDVGPTLGPGSEGAWVERLQRQLNRFIDAGLAVDGHYGPATEQAVAAWQELRNLRATGTTDPSAWSFLLPDRSCATDLVVIEAGQASAVRLDVGWGVSDPASWSGAPDRGPALWVGPEPDVPAPGVEVDGGDPAGILRVDGIGSVDFGAPEAEAAEALLAQLGEPDADRPLEPIGPNEDGCVEGGSWLNCVRALDLTRRGRWLEWRTLGLTVVLTDTEQTGEGQREVPLRLSGWHAVPVTGTVAPTTSEGLRPGSTVGDLRDAAPDVEWYFNEGAWDGFGLAVAAEQPPDCPECDPVRIFGKLDWSHGENRYVAAVQEALNAQGADLAVDGEVGARTRAAWIEFCADHGLACDTTSPSWVWSITEEQRAALEFPPASVGVAALAASRFAW